MSKKGRKKEKQMTTKEKFSAYEKAIAAGGGPECHRIWALFTDKEKGLWKKKQGPLMVIPEQ